MASYTVGKDILSYCGKCKLKLSHIIVSLKDSNTIHRVQCNTCKSVHGFKSGVTKSSGSKRVRTTKKVEEVPASQLWEKALKENEKQSRPYNIRQEFEVGDIIDHKKFGIGIVNKFLDGNKIEVLFRHEYKTLVHRVS